MHHALANLIRNLRAGIRIACFLPVSRLAFRIDIAQAMLLFLLSALIDVAGDYLRVAPPHTFVPAGAGADRRNIRMILPHHGDIAIEIQPLAPQMPRGLGKCAERQIGFTRLQLEFELA